MTKEPNARPRAWGSFDDLYRAEYAAVVGLAYVLSGSRIAAEDLAQEGFLEAYRRWERLAGYDRPEAWVRRVVAHRAISRFRTRSAERKALQRLGGRSPAVAELPEPAAEVWAAVRRLPTKQAVATAMFYYADMSVRDIASAMSCGEGTVKTHLKRARRSLAAALDIPEGAA